MDDEALPEVWVSFDLVALERDGASFDPDYVTQQLGILPTQQNRIGDPISYDSDSDLKATIFPTESKNEDTYTYNDADRMSEVKMKKSTEVLASLLYSRDNDAQVKTVTSKGLPGEEKPAYEYDPNSRLKKGGTIAYEYDAASNPTKLGATTQTFSTADELEKAGTTSFSYAEAGERTKQTPETGAATTYGADQAGNLTTVERPEGESKPKIEDTYASNGEGLRTSQTISGTTTYMDWDTTEELPLLLSDTTNSYIYGPGGIPVEQISSGGTTTYLHHDQQGSIRLMTGSAGTVTSSITFDAYGNKLESTGTISPLGYDGQYTSSDTGLIYMRARTYDPKTAQFLTVDPAVSLTRAPYNYAGDNPLNERDRSGLEDETVYCYPWGCISVPGGSGGGPGQALGEVIEKNWHESENGAERIANGVAGIWNEITGGGNGERNPAQDKKLTDQEIEALKEGGEHPHALKPGGRTEDLYRDREGNVYTKPKGGAGPGEETGLNMKDFGC